MRGAAPVVWQRARTPVCAGRKIAVIRRSLTACLLVLLPAAPALANMGAPWQEGTPAGEPFGALRDVAVEHEALSFDLLPLAGGERIFAVEAVYRLRNDGATVAGEVLFVAPSMQVASVTLDGAPLPATPVTQPATPPSWQPPATTPPLRAGGEPVPLALRSGPARPGEEIAALRFHAEIPPGVHHLAVRYESRAASRDLDDPVWLYQVAYILSPARSWRSFGALDVNVKIPGDWSFASTLPLTCEAGVCRGRFPGLPADTLALSLQPPPPAGGLRVAEALTVAGAALGALFAALLGWAVGSRARRRLGVGRILLVVAVASTLPMLLVAGGGAAGHQVVDDAHLAAGYAYGRMMWTILLAFAGSAVAFLLAPLAAWTAHRRHRRPAGP